MKILHVTYFGVAGKLNGVANAVLNLAKAQIERGEDVKICTFTLHNIIDSKFVCLTPNLSSFKRVCVEFNPDIVSFHSMYSFQQITFSSYLRKRQIPYVLVFHGGASIDNAKKGALKKKIANLLFWNYFISKAKTVVYLNLNEYEKSIFRTINNNYQIIPNGVNIPDDVTRSPSNNKINIAFISRIDFWGKGLDVLLEAIRVLYTEGWNDRISFSFYGAHFDDSYKKFLDFGDFVKYFGFVQGKEREQAFINSSINILPSRSEGMPLTILEALSFGRPCMVTRMTNMADVIYDNQCGWIIDLNVTSIIEEIKDAYSILSIKPDKFYDNCRKVAQEYSWTNVAKKSIEMYKSLKNGRR